MTCIKLTPIRKTGRQMLEELGYKELLEYKSHFDFIDEDDKSSILIRREGDGKCAVFSIDDETEELQGFTSEMILALAQMIKDGDL